MKLLAISSILRFYQSHTWLAYRGRVLNGIMSLIVDYMMLKYFEANIHICYIGLTVLSVELLLHVRSCRHHKERDSLAF